MVSGVGAANASEAKDNCEEDGMQQSICDEYQPVADSGAAAAVSAAFINIQFHYISICVFVVFFYSDVHHACGVGCVHDRLLGP